MNILKLLSVVALGFAMLLSEVSFARGRAGVRNYDQRARIHEGVENGDLNKREAARLRTEQRHIHHAEKKAAADGVVTPEERAKIEKMQDRASRRIYKQKHDDQTRKETINPIEAGGSVTAPSDAAPTDSAPTN